jgi:hypothetical protein
MAIEIVSFPMKNGGSFHSYVNVYQRVSNQDMKQRNNGGDGPHPSLKLPGQVGSITTSDWLSL